MVLEDFTTYTEVDPSGNIAVAAVRCTVTAMQRGTEAYVRKDMGVGYFRDFEHEVTVYLTAMDSVSEVICWAVTGGSSTFEEMMANNEGLVVYFVHATGGFGLYLNDFSLPGARGCDCAFETAYYLRISRAGSQLTCRIYLDSARTNLLTTLQITCASTAFRYIFALASSGFTGTQAVSFYVENLDLQERRVNRFGSGAEVASRSNISLGVVA